MLCCQSSLSWHRLCALTSNEILKKLQDHREGKPGSEVLELLWEAVGLPLQKCTLNMVITLSSLEMVLLENRQLLNLTPHPQRITERLVCQNPHSQL